MRAWIGKLSEYRYVLLVAAAGLLLLLWPGGSRAAPAEEAGAEAHIASLLGRIEGVGRTEVLLSDCGAVVVCEGGGSDSVRLRVTRAVRCYTGLGADEIEIFKME